MNPTDPLAELKDIHLPETISAWPPAYGWWLLAVTIIALLIFTIRWLIARRQKNRYKVEANSKLSRIQLQYSEHNNPLTALESINALLKQTCITRFGRNETAGLSGDEWLAFLDKTGNTKDFSKGPGRCLTYALYAPNPVAPIEELLELTKTWIAKQS